MFSIPVFYFDLHNSNEINQKLKNLIFDWKDKDKPNDQLGFIGQDVEKVLPEVVKEIENGLGDYDGHKVVSYSAVVPVLVEAMKEQQKLINRLEERIKGLENKGE